MTSQNRGHNFPLLQNDRYIRACFGQEVDKIPVWVMRQAGRYLPEFLEFRKQHEFFTVCRTPSLACEVTMMPIRRFDLDAAIIFSDILVVPQALGMEVKMLAGSGPTFTEPLSSPGDLARLQREGAAQRLEYVGEAISLTRTTLEGKVPLIGFSGGPWTLMGYMIEGGGSKTMAKAKRWLYVHRKESHDLLALLTDVIVEYLAMQVGSGAQALQVFESSAEYLGPDLVREFVLPYLKRIRAEVRDRLNGEQLPMTLFAKGGNHWLEEQAQLGYEVIGVDWTIDPAEARRRVGPGVTLQGNLDPPAFYGDEETVRSTTRAMVSKFGKTRYVANLGHGIYPDMPLESVGHFVDEVHRCA